jgi:hypothetical protein
LEEKIHGVTIYVPTFSDFHGVNFVSFRQIPTPLVFYYFRLIIVCLGLKCPFKGWVKVLDQTETGKLVFDTNSGHQTVTSHLDQTLCDVSCDVAEHLSQRRIVRRPTQRRIESLNLRRRIKSLNLYVAYSDDDSNVAGPTTSHIATSHLMSQVTEPCKLRFY